MAYCLLGYLCAYYRYYYPLEFITAYLNDAANDEDTKNGTILAKIYGIKISNPKFGLSKSHYVCTKDQNVIAKGLESVKYISKTVSNELYDLSQRRTYTYFVDLLRDIYSETSADTRQVDILIKIGFFDAFGNQAELLRLSEMFEEMKRGEVKKLKRDKVDLSPIAGIVRQYSTSTNKDGSEAKNYTVTDSLALLHGIEQYIKNLNINDISSIVKVKNFSDIMGYAGYYSDKPEDRRKLYVKDIFPLKRKSDGKQFGYSIITQSVGSGKESRFTVFNRVYNKDPINKNDLILCTGFSREGQYFTLTSYSHIFS